MQEPAFAKLNLALHLRARRPDGYHRIETIFAFAGDGDLLSVEQGDNITLAVTGPFADRVSVGEDNLVMKAARALAARTGTMRGGKLTLTKNLPVASGIGGGSADAAAALRLLRRWWNLADEPGLLHDIAAGLGADVPACLLSRTLRGDGIGDKLTPIASKPLENMPVLLVNPGVPLSTAAVFERWDGVDRGPLVQGDPLEIARAGRNDLEPPAAALAPELVDLLALLRSTTGVHLARMSGSGATCFALFDTLKHRDSAAAKIARRHPSHWTLATLIR